ncbi:hypothetical protein ACP4OV_023435 [Aristida adscensionis]
MARTAAGARMPLAALLVVVAAAAAAAAGMRGAEAQTCEAQLSGLAPCARYSVPPAPGQSAPAPGPECCAALGSVTRDCACATVGIINSLPAKCGLPRVTCLTVDSAGDAEAKVPSTCKRRRIRSSAMVEVAAIVEMHAVIGVA